MFGTAAQSLNKFVTAAYYIFDADGALGFQRNATEAVLPPRCQELR